MTVKIIANPHWFVRVVWETKNRVSITFEKRGGRR